MIDNPTPENVLPNWRPNPKKLYGGTRPPNRRAKEAGAIVAMPGGMPCPWCNSTMEGKEGESYIAVCSKDSRHIVEWLPWGG